REEDLRLEVNGATRLDVCQGKLNDCWLLSAIASLSMYQPLLRKVMPLEQSFQDGYNGCFTFRFWQYGQWEEVRIDDLLPTIDNNLIFLSSPQKNEFWSSLLEKAYAKLKGGYRALDMGFPHEAMVDMTGGVTEVLMVASLPRDLPALLRYLLARGALINCANCQGSLEKRNGLGILFRHAYSLTAVEKVNTAHGAEYLVRILNPWGNTEWEGPWSDMKGSEWNSVSIEEQKRLGRVRREDGEFWMSVSDFRQNFEVMEVCHLIDTLSVPGSSMLPWSCIMHHGNWVPSITAGGSPQGGKMGDDISQKTCSFVLALMQKHQRRRGVDLAIALHIYPDLSELRPVLYSSQYFARREVVLRGSLPPGCYIIIPSTAESNQQGAFLLRVLTEQGNNATGTVTASENELRYTVFEFRLCFFLQLSFPHQAALPSPQAVRQLFKKHCNKVRFKHTAAVESLLFLPGSYELFGKTSTECCWDFCQGMAQLSWPEFQGLWDKIRRWTVSSSPVTSAAGITVDDLVMQLVGLRYTEPDLTISYPGFLYLLMKLESMIRKRG
uniref:Zgc:85932 n=1 Tax=Amphilophus citrinellus TaxID=61819 RepID=A0A3Q0SG77_AMPCI